MIQVKRFYAFNELRNYSYLIYDDQTGHTWVIDPYEANPLIEYIKKNSLVLKGILNTHQHSDHIRGNRPLIDAFGAPVRKLKNAESIELETHHALETLDTPGHTMDHQVFIWKTENKPLALFSGDTLFNAGVGNCKNGGDVGALFKTTQKLRDSLPDDTLLYPGHDYVQRNLEFSLQFEPENATAQEFLRENREIGADQRRPFTLGEEKLVNPFLRLHSEELQHHFKMKKSVEETPSSERDLFIKLRGLRDQW